MGVQAEAYRGILLKDESKKIDSNVDIKYSAPEMRRHFNDAAQGKDVVTQDLVNGLTNNDFTLSRSRPDAPYTTYEEIDPTVALVARERAGILTSEQKEDLNNRYASLSEKTGIQEDKLKSIIADNYEAVSKDPIYKDRPDASSQISSRSLGVINTITHTGGMANASSITVPDYTPNNGQEVFDVLNFSDDVPRDLPNKNPPGTSDQWEFLIALHEAEHKTQKGPQGPHKDIDADRAALKVMDDVEGQEIKEYWLEKRQVQSFKYGLSENFQHDTATFLRVEEQTGQQLDLTAFHAEKRELLERIESKVKYNDLQLTKYGDIMGATQDVLREDDAETDPSKKLSAVQRAEAESFLEDAKAVGYTPNPDYPKAQAQIAQPAQPQAQLQQQVAAAAAFAPS